MHTTDDEHSWLQPTPLDLTVVLPATHGDPGRIASRETAARLHGTIHLPEAATGIVVLVAAAESGTQARHGDLAGHLWRSRIATVDIDLLAPEAARFADAATHLPVLTERLLAVIGQLARMMESDALPALPIGLFAVGDATPVAVRAAAVRDQAVAAVACVGGLVDLAGLQYLRELRAPLLMLAGPDDAAASANLARARPHIPGHAETQALPETGAAEVIATIATAWFREHFTPVVRPRT